MPPETRRWVRERGFKSLIVVTSNYHMPRAIVELSHAMPDITLIPFAVVGDRWRDEPHCRRHVTVPYHRLSPALPLLGGNGLLLEDGRNRCGTVDGNDGRSRPARSRRAGR